MWLFVLAVCTTLAAQAVAGCALPAVPTHSGSSSSPGASAPAARAAPAPLPPRSQEPEQGLIDMPGLLRESTVPGTFIGLQVTGPLSEGDLVHIARTGAAYFVKRA